MPEQPVFERHPANPLLLPKDAPVPCKSVCNPAATEFGGDVLLLTRIIDDQDRSQLWVARSAERRGRLALRPGAAAGAAPEERVVRQPGL